MKALYGRTRRSNLYVDWETGEPNNEENPGVTYAYNGVVQPIGLHES